MSKRSFNGLFAFEPHKAMFKAQAASPLVNEEYHAQDCPTPMDMAMGKHSKGAKATVAMAKVPKAAQPLVDISKFMGAKAMDAKEMAALKGSYGFENP
jgi:hypothetical protein